jgi:lactam utilization protein B
MIFPETVCLHIPHDESRGRGNFFHPVCEFFKEAGRGQGRRHAMARILQIGQQRAVRLVFTGLAGENGFRFADRDGLKSRNEIFGDRMWCLRDLGSRLTRRRRLVRDHSARRTEKWNRGL